MTETEAAIIVPLIITAILLFGLAGLIGLAIAIHGWCRPRNTDAQVERMMQRRQR